MRDVQMSAVVEAGCGLSFCFFYIVPVYTVPIFLKYVCWSRGNMKTGSVATVKTCLFPLLPALFTHSSLGPAELPGVCREVQAEAARQFTLLLPEQAPV